MKKKFVRIAVAAAMVAGFTAAALPATASEVPSGITPVEGLPAPTSDPYLDAMEKLEPLVGTQTEAEINQIANSGEQVELLVDDDNKIIAAYVVEQPDFQLFAISPRGPGCAVGDACAFNGTNNGWFGTGHLAINVKNVTRISAGSYLTTFNRGASGDFVTPNQAKNFESGRNYDG